MAQSTIADREPLLWKFFDYLEEQGITSITAVDPKIMLRYQIHVSQMKNKHGELYDPRVQNRHITAVRRMFVHLRLKGEAFVDPTAGIEMARKPKKLPRDILSVEEMEHLLEQPDTRTWMGIRDRAIMEILYSTAMRKRDLVNLDLNDLRYDERTIFIRDSKFSKDRVVPCGKVAWRCIRKYLKDVRPLRIEDPDEQAVFISQKGGRLGKQGLKDLVDKYAEQSEITKHITPHTFRHSAATHLSDNGADITRIQELLGHEHMDSTAVYIRVSITRLKTCHAACHPRERKQVA